MQGQAALGRSANVSVYGIDPEIAREVPQRPRRYSCAHSLPEDAAPQNTRKFPHLHAFTRVYTLASDPAGAINGVVVNAQRNEGALDIYIVAEIPFSNPVGYHPQMHLLSSPFFGREHSAMRLIGRSRTRPWARSLVSKVAIGSGE